MKTLIAIISLLLAITFTGFGQNLKTEEILAKHLASIGTEKARGAGTNVSIVGDVEFSLARQGTHPTSGRSVFASEGTKVLFAMTFPIPTYPMEKIVFDGKDLHIDSPISGKRSVLGEYIYTNTLLIKGGLLCGVLNKGWALNDLAGRKGKISAGGTKKINGKDAYVFDYDVSKGTGIHIRIFIDKETFRHVRTEYSHVVSAQMGPTPETSAQQSESYQNLTEDFSDFKTENGLTLPRGYKITMNFSGGGAVGGILKEYWYTFALKDFYYDQKLDPATFAAK
ncbi:hypothetical protein BH10ACI3_BH10ACI3_14240 [soil metagenome]